VCGKNRAIFAIISAKDVKKIEQEISNNENYPRPHTYEMEILS
jgi:hypothetical protein